MSIVDSLTKLISEVTQLEQNNKKLNEDMLSLEKEVAEGYKTFNTDTHILVERDVLSGINQDIDEAEGYASYAEDESNSAEGCINEATRNIEQARSYAYDARARLDEILKEEVSE